MKQLFIAAISLLFFISCNQSSDHSTAGSASNKADSSTAEKQETREERNKKIVKEAMAALNAHDTEKMASLMSDDAVDYGDGTGKSIKGRDSIKVDMANFLASFDIKGDNLKYFADGDQVVVLGEYSGTFKKDFGKMKATGKSFKFQDADVFTLNDAGKITDHRYIQPGSTLMSQVMASKK